MRSPRCCGWGDCHRPLREESVSAPVHFGGRCAVERPERKAFALHERMISVGWLAYLGPSHGCPRLTGCTGLGWGKGAWACGHVGGLALTVVGWLAFVEPARVDRRGVDCLPMVRPVGTRSASGIRRGMGLQRRWVVLLAWQSSPKAMILVPI